MLLATPGLAQTPAASAPLHNSDSTVYFYRFRESWAVLVTPSVYSDGRELGKMRNGRFLKLSLEAGPHNITSTFPGSGVAIDMKPGHDYYFRVVMSAPAMFHGSRGQITNVTEDQGRFEVQQLKPAEVADVKTNSGK